MPVSLHVSRTPCCERENSPPPKHTQPPQWRNSQSVVFGRSVERPGESSTSTLSSCTPSRPPRLQYMTECRVDNDTLGASASVQVHHRHMPVLCTVVVIAVVVKAQTLGQLCVRVHGSPRGGQHCGVSCLVVTRVCEVWGKSHSELRLHELRRRPASSSFPHINFISTAPTALPTSWTIGSLIALAVVENSPCSMADMASITSRPCLEVPTGTTCIGNSSSRNTAKEASRMRPIACAFHSRDGIVSDQVWSGVPTRSRSQALCARSL